MASLITRLRSAFYHGDAGWSSLRAWLPAIALMVAIFIFSAQMSLPGAPDDVLDTFLKKFMHAGAYALLARAYRQGLKTTRLSEQQAWLLAWGLAALYALSDELHQSLVPGRNARVADWIIDLCGAGTGLLAQGWPRKSAPAESGVRCESRRKAGSGAPVPPAA